VVDVAAVVVVDAAVVVVVSGAAVVAGASDVVVVWRTPVWGIGPSSSSPQAASASTATIADPSVARRITRRLSTALEHGGRAGQATKPRVGLDAAEPVAGRGGDPDPVETQLGTDRGRISVGHVGVRHPEHDHRWRPV
jgi:hypothetical protein